MNFVAPMYMYVISWIIANNFDSFYLLQLVLRFFIDQDVGVLFKIIMIYWLLDCPFQSNNNREIRESG